ncbi:amidase domain-containing protein [Streptomyces sp. NPDC101165]|uniref:amidase domain-containing protein n=1 Tax=Streptomyces sp. NPDC101165 TaxID=3366119 RepID=UPI003805CE40
MRPAQRRLAFAAAGTAAILALVDIPASAVPSDAPSSSDATTSSLSQLAEGYLQQRADMLTTSPPTLRGVAARIKATPAMSAQTQDDLSALAAKRERYEKIGTTYTKAQVDVSVDDSTVDGQQATLRVTEDTRLYFPFTQKEVEDGAPEYEELSVPHTVKFKQADDGTWLLASDKADADGGPTPTTQVSDVDVEPETTDEGGTADEDEGPKGEGSSTTPPGDTGTETGPGAVKPAATAAYSYNKMIAYADKYWKHHNSAFRTYGGNDCTNFLSQITLAGGWKPAGGSIIQRTSNKYWFYGPTSLWTSYTWGGAENWYWFAIKHSKRTKALRNVYDLLASDVLQADWNRNNVIDHSMFVTKKYRGIPYLTYHTYDTHNKPVNTLVSDHPNTWWYAHRT